LTTMRRTPEPRPMKTPQPIHGSSLPTRAGPAPRTTPTNPQQQLEQYPDAANHLALRDVVLAWPTAIKALSRRATPGTIGLYLSEEDAKGPPEAFLLGTEFAHLHGLPDGGLHLVLPPELHREVIAAGWGIPHTMAGLPTVSSQTLLIFAPARRGRARGRCDTDRRR
jgi:hypothetical protein